MRTKNSNPASKISLLLDEVHQLTQERDDLVLLLLATQVDGVCEVDLSGRPIVLTTYRGPKRRDIRLRWRADVPRISAKTRASLRALLIRDGRI